MLHEVGYQQRREESKELRIVRTDEREVEFFYLRPRDIAIYASSGKLDTRIPAVTCWIDSGADAEEILPLRPLDLPLRRQAGHRERRRGPQEATVATSYEGIVAAHPGRPGRRRLQSSTSTAPSRPPSARYSPGSSPDVVETGTSPAQRGPGGLRRAHHEVEAIVIRRSGAGPDETTEPKVQQFLRRLQGVLVARTYVMMDYDCRVEQLEKAVALTPGLESPTVSPLHNEGLGRRPRDGPGQGSPADHGRPVRDRCPGHP
ncbi:ATP phosphoribosyltransferase [Streptomyces thinghirensis]|nr:ATP phosphoribosyltransferase [Streptomyces thinghirensis]